MAGAWWLAQRLGRELIVDWRGMVFLKDQAVNFFSEYFAQVPEIDGVRVHYAPSTEAGDHLVAHEDETRDIRVEDHVYLVHEESTRLPRYLVLTPYHGLDRMGSGDPKADYFRLQRFYGTLALEPTVQGKVDAFYDERLADAFVVGINLATGNMTSPTGRYYHGRFDTKPFADPAGFLARVRRAARLATWHLPGHLRASTRFFYATDSRWMADLLGQLPDAHARRTVFAPPESGRFFNDYEQLGYSDRAASEDTVVDHFLLGRCDALIYNGSMFSNYARVTTNYFGGNSWNIESLYGRYWYGAVVGRGRRVFDAYAGLLRSR